MPKQNKSRHIELYTVWVHLCEALQAKLIYTDPKQVFGTREWLTGKGQKGTCLNDKNIIFLYSNGRYIGIWFLKTLYTLNMCFTVWKLDVTKVDWNGLDNLSSVPFVTSLVMSFPEDVLYAPLYHLPLKASSVAGI